MSHPVAETSPRITVLIPSLNQGRFLERAICSVIDQGYDNLELIVMDGGSDDETVPLLHHYEDEITLWRSAPDQGPADALNHALRCATGKIVGILGADDLLLPGALEAVAQAFCAGGPAFGGWCIGSGQRIDDEDRHLAHTAAIAAPSLEAYLMRDHGFLPLAGSFFARDLLLRHGGFDPEIHFAYGYELTCRLLAGGVTPAIVAATLVAQREHRASRSAVHVLQRGREFILAAERYADAIPLKSRVALWKNCDERRRIYALAEAEGRRSQARRFLWQQLLKRPWWLASDHYRQTLLRGVRSAEVAPEHGRLAAA